MSNPVAGFWTGLDESLGGWLPGGGIPRPGTVQGDIRAARNKGKVDRAFLQEQLSNMGINLKQLTEVLREDRRLGNDETIRFNSAQLPLAQETSNLYQSTLNKEAGRTKDLYDSMTGNVIKVGDATATAQGRLETLRSGNTIKENRSQSENTISEKRADAELGIKRGDASTANLEKLLKGLYEDRQQTNELFAGGTGSLADRAFEHDLTTRGMDNATLLALGRIGQPRGWERYLNAGTGLVDSGLKTYLGMELVKQLGEKPNLSSLRSLV